MVSLQVIKGSADFSSLKRFWNILQFSLLHLLLSVDAEYSSANVKTKKKQNWVINTHNFFSL